MGFDLVLRRWMKNLSLAGEDQVDRRLSWWGALCRKALAPLRAYCPGEGLLPGLAASGMCSKSRPP